MENNNSSSNSSVCTKIRHVFASNPALRAIQRLSSINQEHKQITHGSNYPSSSPKSSVVQTKPHHKAQTETSSEPTHIKSGYSTPTYKEKGHSSAVSSVAKGASTLVGNSERATKVSAKSELQLPQQHHAPNKAVAHHGNQQGKESVDINDTYREFIQRAKKKIRTVSTIGRGQNNTTAAPDHEVQHGTTTAGKNESREDHFQDFIHRVGKKIRATTMRRN
ncbi:unnamed protein product [Vicia faba]|uniref:Uncharacterized protein n=1 Tax=Vicia faba TaxID=3906 RepID=A0AAV1A3W5_VICFA|nr:unnamed protein product [Vicia faba]